MINLASDAFSLCIFGKEPKGPKRGGGDVISDPKVGDFLLFKVSFGHKFLEQLSYIFPI